MSCRNVKVDNKCGPSINYFLAKASEVVLNPLNSLSF